MSHTPTPSQPRRSARLVAITPNTQFDKSPTRKRNSFHSCSSVSPPKKTAGPVDLSSTNYIPGLGNEARNRENYTLHAHLANGFTSTTYSNKSLDAVLNREAGEVVGRNIRKDIEELTNRGVTNITVKQVLAKNFQNYKARSSLTSERATELVSFTLSENDVPTGVLISGPPVIPSNIKIPVSISSWKKSAQKFSLNAALRNSDEPNFFWPTECSKTDHQEVPKSFEPSQTIFAALNSLATATEVSCETGIQNEHALEPRMSEIDAELNHFIGRVMDNPRRRAVDLKPFAYPGNHLPWHVFWKHVPKYSEVDIECLVDNCRYKPISVIMKEGNFTVPLNKPVKFVYQGKILELELEELLTANGINMYECTHYRKLQGWLQRSGVYIRVDYSDRLFDLQEIQKSSVKKEAQPYSPIDLTTDTLPLICIYPNVYMQILGKKIQGAVIVDTSGDKEPLPGQTFLTTIYSEPLPFDLRQKILVHYDAGIPIDSILKRIGCTERSIKETLGTRLLIDRHLVAEYLKENPESNHHNFKSVGEMMRPKSKIRRTHYVDLNKLVWKYFKDCQATGQQINGKQLKDQAMRYAREMGLETFRGSEGWLDAFKRRHRIDLKAMTGYPVCYENEMYDEVDKECRELDMESHLSHLHNNSSSSFLPHSTVNTAPDEFAASFFSSFTGFPQQSFPNPQPLPEQSSSTHLQNMINMMTSSSSSSTVDFSRPTTSSDVTAHPPETPETVQHVMRSCQIKIADKEISHAFDTLRKHCLEHDQGAMQMLVQLQERLAVTANKNCQNGSSTSST